MGVTKRRIIFGVTTDQSLRLLGETPSVFQERGWDVTVVSGDAVGIGEPAEKTGWRLVRIKMSRRPAFLADLFALVRWIQLLRASSPDVVSAGTPKAAFLALFSSWLVRVPVRIYMLRGLRLETSKGLSQVILRWAERLTSFFSTKVIAVSHSLRKAYVGRGLAPDSKVSVVGFGSSHGVSLAPSDLRIEMPTEVIRSLERARNEKRPVVCFAGRFSRDKGSEVFPKMRASLADRGLDHEFLVLGPIEDSGWHLKVDDTAPIRPPIVAGTVENISPFLKYVDVLALPSLREGLPNVVLEAALASIPAVTTSATGAVDSVIHGITGIIVPPGDAAAFSAAIKTLLCNDLLRERMGASAYHYVSSHFISEKVNLAYYDYLSELVDDQMLPSGESVSVKLSKMGRSARSTSSVAQIGENE